MSNVVNDIVNPSSGTDANRAADPSPVRQMQPQAQPQSQNQVQDSTATQQSQLPPFQTDQGVPLREGEGGTLSSKTLGIAVKSDFMINDRNYQPQQQILNMTPEELTAFRAQADLVLFDNMLISESSVDFLRYLQTLSGVRIAYYPIRERMSDSFAGPPADAFTGQPGGITSPTNANDPTSSMRATNTSVSTGPHPPHISMATLRTIRTSNNFIVQGTSAIFALQNSQEIPENHWDNPTLFKGGSIKTGPLLFINCSQLPSADNRLGHAQPLKPCMHLMIFSPASAVPILVIERCLQEKTKMLRVFNGALEIFGKIECPPFIPMASKKRVVIYGPDQETPIFFIKAAKSGVLANFRKAEPTGIDYVIKRGKTKIGYFTSRYASAEENFADFLPVDLFFPKQEIKWSHRMMLIAAVLYKEYLFDEA